MAGCGQKTFMTSPADLMNDLFDCGYNATGFIPAKYVPFAFDTEKVMPSDAFQGFIASIGSVPAVTNPFLTGAIGVGGVVVSLLRKKLKINRDDLVSYRQATLN
jgi:hypothetical protein